MVGHSHAQSGSTTIKPNPMEGYGGKKCEWRSILRKTRKGKEKLSRVTNSNWNFLERILAKLPIIGGYGALKKQCVSDSSLLPRQGAKDKETSGI